MVSKNRIENHSMNLLTAVATYREDDNTVRLDRSHFSEHGAHQSRATAPSFLSATVWVVLSANV
jgi:hypothetical protein